MTAPGAPPPAVLALARRLVPYAVRRWRALLVVIGVMLAGAIVEVLKPWPLKALVDYVLGGRPVPESAAAWLGRLPGTSTREGLLIWCLGGTVLLFVLTWALGVAGKYANIAFGQRMFYDLARDLFSHLQRLSLQFHLRKSTGDLIRRVTTDCSCVNTIVRDALLPVVTAVFSLATMITIMWRLDPALTVAALAVVPVMLLAVWRYSAAMYEREYQRNEADAHIYGVVEQHLSAIEVVQAFGGERRADAALREATGATLNRTLEATTVQLRFKVLIGLATAVGTAAILWLGGRHVLDGQLTVGTILVFVSYVTSLYAPLQTLMYTSTTLSGAAGSARRVLEVLELTPEVRSAPGAPLLDRVQGRVSFEHVDFGYEPGRLVLHDITLDVAPGEVIALVGPTGAGKSTFAGLIPRFFDPRGGRILIDGHDVRAVDLGSLRQQVSLVLQESFLFPISIAENIAYGRPDAGRADIEAAARAANVHDFIASLPDGYDTVVGERGATLSGGERQRVAIARALLKNAPILILDEPTSALDARTEHLLLEALDRLMAGRTTFIIAHRLSTIRGAHRIAVFDAGRIVELGNHDTLLAAGGRYATLHSLQRRSFAGDGRLAEPA